MPRGRRVFVHPGVWEWVLLSELARSIPAADVRAAQPMPPEQAEHLVVTRPGGVILEGHGQVARWLAWAREHNLGGPQGLHVRVLLAAGDGEPAELHPAPGQQPMLAVVEQWDDPLFRAAMGGRPALAPAATPAQPKRPRLPKPMRPSYKTTSREKWAEYVDRLRAWMEATGTTVDQLHDADRLLLQEAP